MRTPIHVQLRNSLLVEVIGGAYKPGDRFLSTRKICRKWRVSDTSAKRSLAWLVKSRILEARPQSGYYLRRSFHQQALLLLHKHARHKLPSPQDLMSKRFKLLAESGQRLRRVALIWYDSVIQTGQNRLPPASRAVGMEWSQGFFAEAIKHQCEIHFFVHNHLAEDQRFIVDRIVEAKLDGVAVFLRGHDPALPDLLRGLTRAGIPTIRVFGDNAGVDVPTVGINNVGMGYVAARHFLKLGHRRMAALYRPDLAYFKQRIEGFTMAAAEVEGASVDVIRFAPGAQRHVAARLQKGKISAVYSTQIELLAEVAPPLGKRGVRIPEELSVIGCGSVDWLPGLPRPVDSFLINFFEVGRKVFQRLFQTAQGKLREKHTLIAVPLHKAGTSLHFPPA
jgi:DNA-binding LacI/PurR family transcriptional regulator/DNA-binding transcriptional regulator YhcF (GntR family)